jgi:alcohol dehydrogenase class IV
MNFEFSTAPRILFGPGISTRVPELAQAFGKRVVVVTDSRDRCASLLDGLVAIGMGIEVLLVKGEPDIDYVIMATRNIRDFEAQLIISRGGGSTLDSGKAISAMLTNPGSPLDYLEVVGTGRTLDQPSLPLLAIPTTAGTGSEVTRNAVIAVPERRLKASLRSPYLLPKIAVIDPELTYDLPPQISATTGMDALTQLIEPFVCLSPTPLTDALCRDGISRAANSLQKACSHPNDPEARQNMSLASLFGGMALANARLGAVHGMANPIGGMTKAPHGAICARLLPFVMQANLAALRQRDPGSPAIGRYDEIAQRLTGRPNARAEDGFNWLQELCNALHIRPLAEYGLAQTDFQTLAEQSQKSSSMKGNPVNLTNSEIIALLGQAA